MVQEFDRNLNIGIGGFFWVEGNDTDVTYEYNAYMTQKGSILISRIKQDGTECLYWVGKGTFSTVWAARAGYDYVLPNELADQYFDVS